MSTTNTCANCGKGEESSDDLKNCNGCKMVKYCCRDCQIAHRSQHKKACRKRAAELHDEMLFEEPPPREECPICFLPLPLYDNLAQVNYIGATFKTCCGKEICSGCVDKMEESGVGNLCPFCRTPCPTSDEEVVRRTERLMEKGNAGAFCQLAGFYSGGIDGFPQNMAKANELYLKAGELGCAQAYHNLGVLYRTGNGVAIDEKKANHYYELAAMNSDVHARYTLGVNEGRAGNHHRASKHYILAAKAGYKPSLDMVKHKYIDSYVTKEEYANTLREYQKSQDEMKSDARDKAWAARNALLGG